MTVQNPHDKFFRNSFSRREILDSFIEEYLPPEISRAIKMDSIELLSESYVDEKLKDHQTDLLYTAQLDTEDEIYLYFLFEHKSFRDKLVALQVLRYMVQIWDEDVENGRDVRPILPILIYHGEKAWNVAADFHSLLGDMPDFLKRYIPQYDYLLYDYSEATGTPLRGNLWLFSCLLALRSIFSAHEAAQLTRLISAIFDLRRNDARGVDYTKLILYYVHQGNRHITSEQLHQTIQAVRLQEGETMLTMEQFVDEFIGEEHRSRYIGIGREVGREEGIGIGREEGIGIGMEVGKEKTLQEIVDRMLPTMSDEEITRITHLSVEEINAIRRMKNGGNGESR